MKGKAMIRIAALAAVVVLLIFTGAQAQQFKLSSPDIKPNATIADEQVFNGFGCSGKNVSPALQWSFTLHALKVEKLDVPKDAKASLVGFMVNANSIAKATLTGKYGREK
jgi:phosphatidylethanolamine-binding protein (PEBP) family uncharacterized protein